MSQPRTMGIWFPQIELDAWKNGEVAFIVKRPGVMHRLVIVSWEWPSGTAPAPFILVDRPEWTSEWEDDGFFTDPSNARTELFEASKKIAATVSVNERLAVRLKNDSPFKALVQVTMQGVEPATE